ncbi:hypothetical protein T190_19870 [Sinorhizobium meliloti CCBAU 01290]|nr:hypothetical protein T190_19870 [Sinorhizobium meliloti CCBAU 01290]
MTRRCCAHHPLAKMMKSTLSDMPFPDVRFATEIACRSGFRTEFLRTINNMPERDTHPAYVLQRHIR